jgi:HEAT repeat protein
LAPLEEKIFDRCEGDETMNDALDPTPELQTLVEQLGTRNWDAAQTALASTGQAGIAAAIWGLSHPNARVRGGCAAFMDHHGTDACFAPLRQVALHDPAPSVRRMAVHSASCQECKPCPLTSDLVGLLVEVALSDTNRRIRLNALWALHRPQDARAVAALKSILHDADPELQIAAYNALLSQDPTYQGDPVGLHVQVALSSAHKSERLKALLGLRRLPQDPRARAALEQILRTETDPRLRSYAHHALKHQDPSYKAAFDAKARERGIAAARARKEC